MKGKKLFLGVMNIELEQEPGDEDEESNEARAVVKRIMADRTEKIRNKYKTKTIAQLS